MVELTPLISHKTVIKSNVRNYLYYVHYHYRYVLKFKDRNGNTKVNMTRLYLDTWKDSLIPLCADRSGRAPSLCSEFKPSLSDQGFCFTQNHAPIDDIFKSTEYIKTFKKTFHSNEAKMPIMKNKGSGMRYKKSFLINANRVMDLRNGIQWNDTQRAIFRLALHPNFDLPNIRDASINVFAGYKTTIRLNTMQLESDESVKGLELQKRGCRFEFEHENLTLFKSYSR